MRVLTAPGIVSNLQRVVLETHEPIQFIDITEDVAAVVTGCGLRSGQVTIFSRHTTAAVLVQEDEPLLLEDLRRFLRRLAPPDAHYLHNDFRVRTVHMHDDESPNGHSHCLQMALGTSEVLPVEDGELQLGTWQRVFVVELDGPRARREVLIQALGVSD